jgi:hypothetical protein
MQLLYYLPLRHCRVRRGKSSDRLSASSNINTIC